MTDKNYFLLLIIIPVLFGSCESFKVDAEDPVLARVGDEVLTLKSALEYIPKVLISQDTLEAVRHFQSGWIEEKVIESEAVRVGLHNNQNILQRFDRLKSQLIQNALKEAVLSSHREELEVSAEEARNYYQANRERFILEERYVRFRHMTTRTRAEADNARRAIMSGRPWPDVANEFSIDPGRQIRESERFIPVSMAVSDIPAMRSFLNVIGRTEISPVRQHGSYSHFVQLMEDRPAGDYPDLDWLIEQIRDWLYLEKAQRLFNSYKRNLYLQAEANNEIDQLEITGAEEALILKVLQNEKN